jgi:hypothetical protein
VTAQPLGQRDAMKAKTICPLRQIESLTANSDVSQMAAMCEALLR